LEKTAVGTRINLRSPTSLNNRKERFRWKELTASRLQNGTNIAKPTMKFQGAQLVAVLSIAASLSADAYAPSSFVSRSSAAFVTTSRIPKMTNSQLYSQWDEDDEEETTSVRASPSFDEAGKTIGEEDDKAAMDDYGDFDASGTYDKSDIERYREAIKKRTEALGMEKRTPEEIAAAMAAAKESRGREGDSLTAAPAKTSEELSEMLDLSQITSDAPRGPDENLPAMLYDPRKDMTQEEMEQADPTGLLPWQEQISWVLSKSEFPSALSAIGETVLLVVTVTVTALVITQWDELMRQVAFDFKMVPRPEEVASSMEGMIMPGDSVLGMGGGQSGGDLLKMLQEGTQETIKAAKDGTLKDILAGDVPDL